MAPIAIQPSLPATAVAAALARAGTGRAAWVAVSGPVSARPLLSLAPGAGVERWSWVGPDGDVWLGLEAARVWEAHDAAEALALPDVCRTALRHAVNGTAETLALLRCFGGLAFDPAAPGAPLGGEAPLGRFALPAGLLKQTANGATVAVALTAALPDESAAAVATRVQAAWTRLAAWAEGPAEVDAWPAAWCVPDPGAQAEWEHAVERALDAIQTGDVAKVVLARAIPLQARAVLPPGPIFKALAEGAPGTFRFLFEGPSGAFLGASPERLFARSGRELTADGLAGTAPRGEDGEADAILGDGLMASVKDRHEHDLVVEAIAEALAPFAKTLDVPRTPGLKQLPTVQHLHTPIRATLLGDAPLGALLAAMHPTPAVGGTPRHKALKLIRQLESGQRGWYAGPVGWVGRDEAEFAVAIRSAYLRGHRAAVMAGAGIVAGSVPVSEWTETARKAAPLVRLLTREVNA